MAVEKKVMRLLVWCSVILVFCNSVEGQSCPESCLCFSSTVRCMFLHLQRLPTVPKETKVLDLRFNSIREVPPGIFKNQGNLNTLLLNNNHITRLQNGSFEGMKNLRHLYLHKNRIKVLESAAFRGLDDLEQLYLHFNQIQNLEPATFSNLRALDRLFLHNNKLTRIPVGTFKNVTALRRLRLDSNALVCDCNLMWLANMLKETHGLTQAAATCEHPSDLQGKSLTSLTESEIKCKKPVLMEEPRDVDVDFGGTAYFNCKAEGDPDPDILWLHNNNEIGPFDKDHHGRYSVLGDGTLMIENAQADDKGIVECMAKNSVGEVKSRRAAIKYHPLKDSPQVTFPSAAVPPPTTPSTTPTDVTHQRLRNLYSSRDDRAKPQLTVTPIDQSVQVGQRITFECKASGKPEPTITWTKDGAALARRRNRYQHQVEGSLVITEAGFDDQGTYECLAANYLGSATAAARLLVQETPSFAEAPKDRTVAAGENVEFHCRATGQPAPKLTWFKNGRALGSRQGDGRFDVRNDGQVLRIYDVGKSDEATYLCRADNAAGTRDAGADLLIKDKAPPSFLRKPQNLEAAPGEDVQLVCSAVGDPVPRISWRKDSGERIEPNQRRQVTSDGTLRMTNVTKQVDEGLYQCIAENSLGVTTTSAYLTVRVGRQFPVGESVVRRTVNEARRHVDRAINDTLRSLFANPRSTRPSDLLRVARFPNEHAVDIARAAEVYETALLAVRQYVRSGATFNNLSDFSYESILSPSNLQLMANLSGCLVHRRVLDCTDMCFHSKYRTFDGTCNNFQHPMWGASETAFRRLLKPQYENGFSTPIGWTESVLVSGFKKPSARLVSSRVIATRTITADEEYSHMLMQWGQFLDHDLDLAPPTVSTESFVDGTDCSQSCDNAPPCFPIQIPAGDERITTKRCMEFTRSSPVCGSGGTSVLFNMVQPREQLNVLTAYIDASQVYGSSEAEARHVRDTFSQQGLLRVGIITSSGKHLLPFNDHWPVDCRKDHGESDVGCFLAGDVRVNEQLALIAMHTVWFREHNRVAVSLHRVNPHWDNDMLYHEARKIVGAQMQHITYSHWLPKVLGQEGMRLLGPYKGYDPQVEAGISNSFATAALRFGHTLINPVLHRLNSSFQPIPHGHVHLRNAFFSPFRIIEEGGIDPLLRGLFSVPAKLRKSHQLLNNELTEQLFRQVHHVALDLAAINIQRGRDHGIPSYNSYRKLCNLSEANNFHDLRHEIRNQKLRESLQELYGHPSNIDLWVGGVSEDLVDGARVGPTFMCILVDQFRRLRDGDRFYYERAGVFSTEKLDQIKQSSLSRILCDNADNIEDITLDSFVVPQKQDPQYVKCPNVPFMDLNVWTECCHDCNSAGQFNSVIRLPSRSRRSLQFSYPDDKPLNGTTTQTAPPGGQNVSRTPSPYADDSVNSGYERLDGIEDVLQRMEKMIETLSKKINKLEEKLSVSEDTEPDCVDGDDVRQHAARWKQDSCTECTCQSGTIKCFVERCEATNCNNPIRKPNGCCAEC